MFTEHKPVLLEKTIDYLQCKQNRIYLDGTLGRGGHTEAILNEIGDTGLVIGIDRDLKAIKDVKKKFSKYNNLKLVHDNFIHIPEILEELHINAVDGMIFDLGISSPQVDNPDRGFSYQKEGPLDMRMNREQSITAADIVNNYTESELTRVISEYGEENWASRIAEFIVNSRNRERIDRTDQLVEIIKNAIPASARRTGGHPARRTFQALRIETNNELKQLKSMISEAVKCLKPEARICIISFHSLEDRIVKHTFRELARDCICPPDLPICTCNHQAEIKVITRKPVTADSKEIKENPRARSAKLRVAQKVLK